MATFEEELKNKGYLVYTAVGNSMRPLIRPYKDVIVVEPWQNYTVGDVVLYRNGEQYVLHRIAEICQGRYRIIGDNCIRGQWVCGELILGRLTQLRRGGKRQIPVDDDRYLRFVDFRRRAKRKVRALRARL